MNNKYFITIENKPSGTQIALSDIFDHLSFDSRGLLPVITQDAQSREVLMLAWMNREALKLTLSTGRMVYWSRSRKSLWRKGESSGHTQHLKEISFDCDGDTILCLVDQKGFACHTNRSSCFYLQLNTAFNKVVVA